MDIVWVFCADGHEHAVDPLAVDEETDRFRSLCAEQIVSRWDAEDGEWLASPPENACDGCCDALDAAKGAA